MLNQDQIQEFVDHVNKQRKEYHESQYSFDYNPINFKVSRKYVKLVTEGRVWGFIAKADGVLKGEPIKEGDLLMPASWNAPAKHARGNILDGTAEYGYYGPNYKKVNNIHTF